MATASNQAGCPEKSGFVLSHCRSVAGVTDGAGPDGAGRSGSGLEAVW